MRYIIPIKIANTIVDELKTHVNTNFNFMNHEGYIIAAVDKERVGNLHMGAKKVLDEDLDILFVTDEMNLANTKEGINMAIKIKGQAVGVLGITGKKDQIMQYATIVKRMTEIMLEDYMFQEEIRLKRHIIYRFIEQWIKEENPLRNKDLIEKSESLGIDLNKKRRVITLTLDNYDKLNSTLEGQKIIDAIDDIVREFTEENPTFLYLYLPSHYTFIVSSSEINFIPLLKKLCKLIKYKHKENLRIGIDSDESGNISLSQPYQQALKAMEIARKKQLYIVFYNEFMLENFLYDIAPERMQHYLDLFLDKIKPDEVNDYINLIDLFFQYEGSIKQIAKAKFVHINTIQYRLQKLIDFTGYDIRKPSESIYFQLLLRFYRILTSTQDK